MLLGPGDHAIVTWPGYQSLYEVGRAAGADVTLHELHESDGWALDVDRLRAPGHARDAPRRRQRAAQPDRDAAGPSDLRRRSSRSPRSRGAHLLVDEVYRFLEFDEADRLPAGADALERGISLGVMSKSFAMAGPADRLAGDARPRPARPAGRVQGLHDDLLVGAVGDPRAHRAAGRATGSSPGRAAIVAANLELLDAFFDDWADRFTWVRPRGGSIGFPRLTVPGVRIDDWAAELVEAEGVLLAAGLAVRVPGQPLPDRLRPDGPARGARAPRGLRRRTLR